MVPAIAMYILQGIYSKMLNNCATFHSSVSRESPIMYLCGMVRYQLRHQTKSIRALQINKEADDNKNSAIIS